VIETWRQHYNEVWPHSSLDYQAPAEFAARLAGQDAAPRPIRPVTTRINLHRADCRRCGRTVIAAPPAYMPPGSSFGPSIVALVAYLHGCLMVSYAHLAEMLDGTAC
jgi:hypothetical protein